MDYKYKYLKYKNKYLNLKNRTMDGGLFFWKEKPLLQKLQEKYNILQSDKEKKHITSLNNQLYLDEKEYLKFLKKY